MLVSYAKPGTHVYSKKNYMAFFFGTHVYGKKKITQCTIFLELAFTAEKNCMKYNFLGGIRVYSTKTTYTKYEFLYSRLQQKTNLLALTTENKLLATSHF